MKILKRNYEHRNLVLFLLLSTVYLQAIYSLSIGQSVLSFNGIKSFFGQHYIILTVTVLTILMILNVKKHSDKILLVCLMMIAGKNFILLASSFNKLILGLNFVYLIFAFYFFVTWELEIAKASYNPSFSKNDLEKETRLHLKGVLENPENGESFEVSITNIDDNSCFVILANQDAKNIISKLNPHGIYQLKTDYEGVCFSHKGSLASTYDIGIGLNLIKEKSEKNILNWSDLYKVCLDRGLFQ